MNTDQVTHGTGNLRRRVPGKWARIFLNHSRVTFHLQVVCCDSLAPKMPVLNVHEFENGPIIPKILVHIDGHDLPLKKMLNFHGNPIIFPWFSHSWAFPWDFIHALPLLVPQAMIGPGQKVALEELFGEKNPQGLMNGYYFCGYEMVYIWLIYGIY